MADFTDQTAANFEEELSRARGYKPVTKKEMRQAYSQYSKEGLKFGQVDKNATDEQLYQRAQDIVLAWWKQQQKDEKAAKHKKQQQMNDPLRGIQSSWTGGAYSGGGTGGSTGGSSGGGLPDTAMSTRRAPQRDPLPDIRKMNPRHVREVLDQMGVPETWVPPKAALRDDATLQSWAQHEAQRRELVLRANGLRAYYNNQVVRQIADRVGFPINPASVPLRKRQSHDEIRRYILDLKRAWERAQAARREQSGVDATTVNRTSAAALVKMRNSGIL